MTTELTGTLERLEREITTGPRRVVISLEATPNLIAALREAVKALESYRNETHGYGVAQRALATIENLLKP